jgi:hypothetical protein
LPSQIYIQPKPEHHAQYELTEKSVVYHVVPPPMGRNVGMPPVPRAGNFPARSRYTTHLTFRARIKRLVRKTICFSKSIQMHQLVIGLFINRFEFGLAV